jgi:glucosamine--fructose-6-phosphate aminotransferase (isomerizing)
MCGIVGYIGEKNSIPILIEGLKRLEYRGYDSAGIGVISNKAKEARAIKSLGKVSKLEDKIEHTPIDVSSLGIAHTRWATHGEPSENNAHPHFNKDKTLYIVHNGIIENYTEIKIKLIKDGYEFVSQTDTEVLVHLIDSFLQKGNSLLKSVQLGLSEVNGTYGVAAISKSEPDKMIVAKKGSPLVIGIGDGEHYVASDVNALIGHTSRCIYLEDGEIVEVTKDKFTAKTIDDKEIEKDVIEISVELNEISKGDYPHYMLKEIFEQVNSVRDSFRGRILMSEGTAKLGGIEQIAERIANSKRLVLSACGTSWHSGLVAEYMLEQFTGIPVEVDYASEFRYRNPIVDRDDAMFFITQSGETADTLAAMKEAKRRDALILGVCNVVGSSIARESEAGVYVHAGPEIGVASTKAFTSQLVVFALISILIGRKRHLSLIDGQNILRELESLPKKIEQILKLNSQIEAIAEKFVDAKNFLYLGRGYNFPVALEGALKMKEISYIHAEGYPAAEMKHGPIALIDENMPVIFIAPKDSVYDKVITNIEEVKARKGIIIAIASENDNEIDKLVDYSIKIPDTIRMLMPILTVIPLQLLAYHVAVKKGLNVDQPRNLAKSVTVE